MAYMRCAYRGNVTDNAVEGHMPVEMLSCLSEQICVNKHVQHAAVFNANYQAGQMVVMIKHVL